MKTAKSAHMLCVRVATGGASLHTMILASSSSLRCFHSPTSSSGSDPTSLAKSGGDAESLEWMMRMLEKRLAEGKITKAAFNYNVELLSESSIGQSMCKSLFDGVGDQDVEKMTRFQKQMIFERASFAGAHSTAQAIQQVFNEEQGIKKFSNDGTPTGESYWFEDSSLLSNDIPAFVKDEVYEDMKKNRREDSPAHGNREEGEAILKSLEDQDRQAAAKAGVTVSGGGSSAKAKLSFGPA